MAHELTPCQMRSPLKTILLLQHLSGFIWNAHAHFSHIPCVSAHIWTSAASCYLWISPPVIFPAPLSVCPPSSMCMCVLVKTPALLCIPDSPLWCRGSRLSYDSSWALSEISEVRHKRIQADRAAERHTKRNRLNKRVNMGLKSTARS